MHCLNAIRKLQEKCNKYKLYTIYRLIASIILIVNNSKMNTCTVYIFCTLLMLFSTHKARSKLHCALMKKLVALWQKLTKICVHILHFNFFHLKKDRQWQWRNTELDNISRKMFRVSRVLFNNWKVWGFCMLNLDCKNCSSHFFTFYGKVIYHMYSLYTTKKWRVNNGEIKMYHKLIRLK